jgi:BTB/POZ domain
VRLLLEKGLFSDIEIVVNGDEANIIRAHKGILMARSERFKAMIESHMKESITNRIEVNDPDISV